MQRPPSDSHRLALAQHARREAIFDAREARGELPTIPPPAPLPNLPPRMRASLPSVDELVGPDAPKARWKLVLALGAGLMSLAELARQIVELVRR